MTALHTVHAFRLELVNPQVSIKPYYKNVVFNHANPIVRLQITATSSTIPEAQFSSKEKRVN